MGSKAGVTLPSIKELSTLIKQTNPIVRFDHPTITFHKSATVSQTAWSRMIAYVGCRSHCIGKMSIVCTNFTFYYYSFFVDDSGGHKVPPISRAQCRRRSVFTMQSRFVDEGPGGGE